MVDGAPGMAARARSCSRVGGVIHRADLLDAPRLAPLPAAAAVQHPGVQSGGQRKKRSGVEGATLNWPLRICWGLGEGAGLVPAVAGGPDGAGEVGM